MNLPTGACKLWVGEYRFVEGHLLLCVESTHLNNKMNQEHWKWEGRTSIRDTTQGTEYDNDFLWLTLDFPIRWAKNFVFINNYLFSCKPKYSEQCRIQRYIIFLSCLYHPSAYWGEYLCVLPASQWDYQSEFSINGLKKIKSYSAEWIWGGRGLLI